MENKMTINQRLLEVQKELKAPKNKYNSFGKYNYRSCEDIMEAVKPLLYKHGLTLYFSDDIIGIEGHLILKTTATLMLSEDAKGVLEQPIQVSACAGHDFEKKGMDFSQITGCASSYARKYCLNGLFLIDDTKDADTDEYHKQTTKEEKPAEKPAEKSNTHPQEGAIYFHLETAASMADLEDILKKFNLTKEELKNYPKLREAFNTTAKSFNNKK